jgi:hypothetical protein
MLAAHLAFVTIVILALMGSRDPIRAIADVLVCKMARVGI